jgi:hydrogenase expression/formation protein HypE
VVAVIDPAESAALLRRWRALPQGGAAALVGHLASDTQQVTLVTELGGERMLDELEDDPLPRIC